MARLGAKNIIMSFWGSSFSGNPIMLANPRSWPVCWLPCYLVCICIVGVKFDLGTGTDLTEASVLGYKNSYIKVYSNSWGPNDFGFIVSGPGTLAKRALATGVTQVCT